MLPKSLLLTIFSTLFLCSCNSDDTNSSEENDPIITGPLVFIVAGQSNAQGMIKLSGLEGIKATIPSNTENLTTEQRNQARIAVANSLGLWCDVEEACAINPETCPNNIPFSHQTADAVIDGLRNSAINWREITRNYTNESVRIKPFNYRFTPVTIQNNAGENIDNADCVMSPDNTTLAGPVLSQLYESGTFPLGPGYGGRTDADELSYGPELSFGLEIAKNVTEPIIIKISMGGSSINDHWRNSGTLYNTLIAETKKALIETNANLGGLIWFQGFNDQFKGAYCNELPPLYENNLKRLFSDIRTGLSAPEMPVVIVEARNGGAAMTAIQNAQNNVANTDQNVSLVPSKDLSDCFHYGSGSHILIGERVAKSMKELLIK